MSNQSIDVVGSHPSIGPNDVLLGRGNHLHICGNERFRSLVRSRSVEYWSCNDNVMKDNIARQIADSITAQHGRFLRKVKTTPTSVTNPGGDIASARDTSVAVPTEQWEVADTETILVKVKQTFRDFTASNKKRAGASAHKKQSLPSYERLPEVSILERLQNSANLSSFPLATLPDTNDSSRKVSSLVASTCKTDGTSEMLFQNARAAQLGHLAHNAQQQLINETSQDQQLMSLFEQQRAILMKQLQQSQFIQPTQPPPQQYSQHQITSHQQQQQQLATQPAPSSLRQESMRQLSSTGQHLSPILFNQLMHQSQQDQLSQGRNNDLVQQSHLIDQQLRELSRFDDSTSHQPQYLMTNQNEQQNQVLSSMNLHAMPNRQSWSQQPSWHNLSSTSAPVRPTFQSQSATSAHSNYINERLNDFLNQSNLDVPTSVTHRMNMPSDRITNDVTAISGETHLPGAMPYHPPPLPQVPVAISAGAVDQSSSICHEDDNDSDSDDEKPPGL